MCSNDGTHWHLAFKPPFTPGTPSKSEFSGAIPIKCKFVKLVWAYYDWNGIGEPVHFSIGRCPDWECRNPQQFYAYLFDFKYSDKYALNLANYVLSHRSSSLAWGSPVNPNVTLTANRATSFGWIQRWNVYTQPVGSNRPSGIYFHSTGRYGTQNLPSIIPSIFPPGTYRTPDSKPVKYVDLVPGWKYGKEPVHTTHSTVTVHNFIALLPPSPFLFPVKIFTPSPTIKPGIFNSNLSLLSIVNGKPTWIKRGENRISGTVVIDHWKFEVPSLSIRNLKIVGNHLTFYSNYTGKAVLTVDGKSSTINVKTGLNSIPLPNGKKICIDVEGR